MAELMEHVQALADDIGPRPVSTEEEHQASLYVAQKLQDAGLEVSLDEFMTPTGVRWPYALSFLLVICGTVLSGFGKFVPGLSTTFFAIGLLLVAASMVFYFTERMGRPILSKALTRGVSQNVVARYVPSSVARERRRRKVIVVAHVDTVRAQPEACPALVNIMPVLKKAIYYCMIAMAVLFVVRMLPLPWPDNVDFGLWIVSLVIAVFLFVCTVCIVVNRFMPYVSGANDNASSLAVLIGLARRLLDPAERERYAKGNAADEAAEPVYDENGEEIPVETFLPEQEAGSFDASEFEPVIHGPQEAAAADVIPQGAQVTYEQDALAPVMGETVAFPALGASDQAAADVDGVDAADTPAATQSAQDVPLGGAWPKPAVTAGDEREAASSAPVQEPAVAPVPVAAPVAVSAPAAASKLEAKGLPSWYTAAKAKAAATEANAEEQEAGAAQEGVRSQYANMPTTREQARAMQAKRQAASAPQDSDDEDKAMIEAIQNRSVDDLLVDLGVDPQEIPAGQDNAPASAVPATESAVAADAQAPAVPEQPEASAVDADASVALATPEAEPAVESARDNVISIAAFKGELADASIDDIDPDSMAGTQDADEEPVEGAVGRLGLTGRIPVIADDAASNSFATYAAVDSGDAFPAGEQEGIGIADSGEGVFGADALDGQQEESQQSQGAGLAAGLTGSFKALQARRDQAKAAKAAAKAAQPKRNAKPTARRVSDDFEPTKVGGRHADAADMLASSRQAAAVSSTYQDTIQAAPQTTQAFDPFAPKGDPAANASLINPSVSTSFPAVSPALSAEFPAARDMGANAAVSPSATSSFPSLTGSFPSLTGSFASVSNDFDQPGYDEFNDSDLEAFNGFAPDVNVHIDAPASRMHGFMDKVGGIFGKFGKKNKEEELGFEDGWNDDDNGWKGGAYFDEDLAADSHAAVRARAAQIRESVVSMTENDLLDKEVWFVALGASSAGNRGMRNFLELHKSDLRGALIVNLEGIGAGDICFVDYEGLNKTRRSDRRLQSLVRKSSKELDGVEMSAERLDWRDTDATPAMEAGCRAMTIMGFDGVAPTGWHWTSDYTGIVEEEKLEYVTGVLMKMIENS